MSELRRPKVGLAVIVVREQKILLGRRINAHGEGTWCFPGGHLEWNESWEECARRESMEEAGIELHNVRHVGATNDVMESDDKHYITIFMQAECTGEPKVCEPDKMLCWDWHAWEEMPHPRFVPIGNLIAQGFHPLNG